MLIVCCATKAGKVLYLEDTLGKWTEYKHMAIGLDAWQAEEWLTVAGYEQTGWLERAPTIVEQRTKLKKKKRSLTA